MSRTNGDRSYREILNNKTIFVTGGTDSLGHQVIENLMSSTPVFNNMVSDLGLYLHDGYYILEIANEYLESIVVVLCWALALTLE